MPHRRAPVFPLRAVAGLFLERQWLDRPRGRRLTAAHLRQLAERTGGLQIDTINVVDRAHYLTVWSRFGAFDHAALDRLIYRKRVLFEYWSHAACYVAVSDFPAWRRAMLDYERQHTGWTKWLKKHRPTLELVEREVREHGPIGSAHFAHEPPRTRAAGWWNWKPSSHAFDYLWKKGVLAVESRVHFHRRLDLIERVLPRALEEEPLSPEAFRRWHVAKSLRAMGAATETDLRMYLTFPRTPAGERRRTLEAMLGDGTLVEVQLKDERPPRSTTRWFALAEDLPALESAGRRRAASRGSTLLSPFDSFLWHRERTRRLFGYDYTIEVYTPGHKRVHGYYSLPIFHDGQLIGRLDPKTHRAERRLEVKNLHFEPWFARAQAAPAASWGAIDRDAALAGLADSLRSLARFVGADELSLGRVSPAVLRPPLSRSLELPPAKGIV